MRSPHRTTLARCQESKKVGKYFYDKYGGADYEDYTKNVYGTKETHHLGMFFSGDECLLTSGMHVHFSLTDKKGKIIPFTEDQIKSIVIYMDNIFKEDIERSKRVPGEWEPKEHGFEYRSIPCDADPHLVLEHAFKILREV